MTEKYTVVVAGSTRHARMCAEALIHSENFTVTGVITPTPKPIGRKQIITPNPIHLLADSLELPTVQIEKKIDEIARTEIDQLTKPDFLLVVDFGYIIPDWLIKWPQVAPINIHPSLLPRWRGSSPGQFVLLYDERQTGCSVIIVNSGLDQGPIISQLPFNLEPHWTQTEYYQHAFNFIATELPHILVEFAKNGKQTPQPTASPTPLATRLDKQMSFIPWDLLETVQEGRVLPTDAKIQRLSPVLQQALQSHQSVSKLLDCACRAFSPWPGLWTIIPTKDGEKRLKVLSTTINGEKLILQQVQLEGKTATNWEEIKATLEK